MLEALKDRRIILIIICQALGMSVLSLQVTVGALAGANIAPNESLATLPHSLVFVGIMASTIPASLFMGRYGRRLGFSLGAVIGILATLVMAASLWQSSFLGFSIGCLLLGSSSSFVNYYRFAAAEAATDEYRSRVISYTLAGGVVAAFAGPTLAENTRLLFPGTEFSGSYLLSSLIFVVIFFLVQGIRIPIPTAQPSIQPPRAWSAVLTQPKLITAILCGMMAYGAMNMVMVPTPLAMDHHGHMFGDTAFVIQWHGVGMFAPSFITGTLIVRYGLYRIMLAGCLLLLLSAGINLSGISTWHFWSGLLVLGVGWNFVFIGATALLTETYQPEEQSRVQGLNDFLVYGTTVLTAFGSGFLFNVFGWDSVNIFAIPATIIAMASIFYVRQAQSQPTLEREKT